MILSLNNANIWNVVKQNLILCYIYGWCKYCLLYSTLKCPKLLREYGARLIVLIRFGSVWWLKSIGIEVCVTFNDMCVI